MLHLQIEFHQFSEFPTAKYASKTQRTRGRNLQGEDDQGRLAEDSEDAEDGGI